MPTRAPSAASPAAVALPMPPVPPVTSTYLPAIEGASVMACSCLAAVGKLDNRSLVPGGQPGCAGAVAGEECQDFAGRCQSPAVRHWQRSAKRQVGLDLVAVAAAVLVLDDVPGPGEIGDDAVSGALGDARPGRDVAQPHARVAGDAQQHPGVVGQETPVRHARTLP